MPLTLVPLALLGWAAPPAAAGRKDAEPNPMKVVAMRQMRDGALKVGDPAPNPGVVNVDGTPRPLLAERGTRPLVVVFGSFT